MVCVRGRVKFGWVFRIKINGMVYLEYLFFVSIGLVVFLFNFLMFFEVSIIILFIEGK